VDAALQFAGTDPMLTFLDPFGTPLAYDVLVTQLLGRPPVTPTEVLLNLNLESVSRIGGLLATKTPKPHHELTLGRLDTSFGGAWWRDTFRSVHQPGVDGSAAAAAQQVASEFMTRVRDATGFGSFGVPVRRRPGHQPLFLLMLFTRYPLAPWKFNEVVSLANADWRDACWQADVDDIVASVRSGEPDLFGDNTETWLRDSERSVWERAQMDLEAQWVGIIEANLRQLLIRQASVRLAHHLDEAYGETLGLARDKHVNRAWDRLAAAGLARLRPKGARLERETVWRAGP
jgi:hypothetical protein